MEQLDQVFLIPLKVGDLQKQDANNRQYYVDRVLELNVLPSAIHTCKLGLRNGGPLMIGSNFPAYYSLLSQFSSVNDQAKFEAWNTLLQTLKDLKDSINNLLANEGQSIDKIALKRHMNALKMLCYLLCQLISTFETESRAEPMVVTGRRKKGATKGEGVFDGDWPSQRLRAVELFLNVLQLPVHRLWTPPVPEDDFISLVSNTCFKLLENPLSAKPANKPLVDLISAILAVFVRRYNHEFAFCLKLFQWLKAFEHMGIVAAIMMEEFVKNCNLSITLQKLMSEIGDIDDGELSHDGTVAKTIGCFLEEASERIPEAMLLYASLVIDHLNSDVSYTLRIGVLSMVGNIVERALSGNELDSRQKAARLSLLDKLYLHLRDTNAHVRSRVLQTFQRLISKQSLPLEFHTKVLQMTVRRLHDSSSVVRSKALTVLLELLRLNMVSAALDLDELHRRLADEQRKLRLLTGEGSAGGSSGAAEGESEQAMEKKAKAPRKPRRRGTRARRRSSSDEASDDNADDSDAQSGAESAPQSDAEQAVPNQAPAPVVAPDDQALLAQRTRVRFLEDVITLRNAFEQALQVVVYFLYSKTNSDVLEAIEFFLSSYELGYTQALVGVRKMLPLIEVQPSAAASSGQNQPPNPIKDKVVEAYRRLYLQQNITNRLMAEQFYSRVAELISGATFLELDSLQQLIAELHRQNCINDYVLQVICDKFTQRDRPENCSEQEAAEFERQSKLALVFFRLVASEDKDLVREHVNLLYREGFLLDRCLRDYDFVVQLCWALRPLISSSKPINEKFAAPVRLEADHAIWQRLGIILLKTFDDSQTEAIGYWETMCLEVVKLVYGLAEHPEQISESIIYRMMARMRLGADTLSAEQLVPALKGCNRYLLGRLLAMVGQVAVCHLHYLDIAVYWELKRRAAIKEERAEQKKAQRKGGPQRPSLTTRKSGARMSSLLRGEQVDPMEEEMGLVGAQAEDVEAEWIRNITERKLINGKGSLLALFGPLIIDLCRETLTAATASGGSSKAETEYLAVQASLALAKFMTVSSEFCAPNLQLLFTLLDKSRVSKVRSNVIIAMRDLIFRFPNLIEPWSPHLYSRLHDADLVVAHNALIILSHIILNDMTKVKGHISELAKCLCHADEEMRQLTQNFFQELAKKAQNSAVYNLLPDIISRLSDAAYVATRNEDDFRTIIKFLFAFVQKERQKESLVEKLLARFKIANDEQLWRDLSYCLTMLPLNEACLQKFQQYLDCYATKMGDDRVFEMFEQIVQNFRRSLKAESMEQLDEWERKLQQLHRRGDDGSRAAAADGAAADDGGSGSAASGDEAPDALPPPPAPEARPARAARGRPPQPIPQSPAPSTSRAPPRSVCAQRPAKTQPTAVKKAKRPFNLSDSSDNEAESEPDVRPTQGTGGGGRTTRQRGGGRGAAAQAEESSDEERRPSRRSTRRATRAVAASAEDSDEDDDDEASSPARSPPKRGRGRPTRR